MSSNVIVIGGGAAGLIASAIASKNGASVILIEKNNQLGKKLRITGKGRCNITNSCDTEDFFKNVATNSKFLYSALYSFTNYDIISILEEMGVKTKVERGGRVFPVSDNAHDVAEALIKYAKKQGVRIIKGEAKTILTKDNTAIGVKLKSGEELLGKVILATGGKSYVLTGSDGYGYEMAKRLGHTIIEPKPSLIPIITEEKWTSELSGLSLKNVTLTLLDKKNKEIFSELGEMLFTHFGVSGPLILSASAHMKKEITDYKLVIDLKPALDYEKLDLRIRRDFEENINRDLQNSLDKLLPKSLIPIIIKLSNLDGRKKINSITKEERFELAKAIKELTLSPIGFRPLNEAIITSGGISVKEINPSTMESKLVSNLYFAGEIIDVDAYTGGFNLQIAWSTGYLAGISSATS